MGKDRQKLDPWQQPLLGAPPPTPPTITGYTAANLPGAIYYRIRKDGLYCADTELEHNLESLCRAPQLKSAFQ